MTSTLTVLSELEAAVRHNLLQYLRREIDREYQSKHKNKAQKLAPSSLESLDLNGEQIRARVQDGGQSFRVDMTFPLFDLDTDFTLIQCSCMREALSLEALRCHHMYFVQKSILLNLEQLASVTSDGSPLAIWEALWQSPEEVPSGEHYLREETWRLLLDVDSWQARFERRLTSLYGGASEEREPSIQFEGWKANILRDARPAYESWRSALALGGGQPDRELFELLLAAVQPGPLLVVEAAQQQPLTLIPATWHVRIEESEDGYWLRPQIGDAGLPIQRLIAGKGAVSWNGEPGSGRLYLCRLEARAERFVEQLMVQKRAVPAAERERMLSFLNKLDPRLLDLSGDAKGGVARPVAAMQGVLRLTPFARGGMKVEVLVQIAPQIMVVPGEGAEQLRELAERGAGVRTWERDLQGERQLARRLSRRLDLDILPEPEPGIFIAYNDTAALDLMQRVEAAQQEAPFIIEWPEALRQGAKPYALSGDLEQAALHVSIGEKKDWFQLEGWLELDEGHKLSLRELLAAVRQQKKYIQLANGRWAIVSEHFRQKMEPLLAASEDDGDDCSFDLAVVDQDAALQGLANFPFAETSKRFWQLIQKARRRKESEASLPSGLRATLRPYQIDGYRWMHHLYEAGLGACLADDMGLGKTVQTLALLLKQAHNGPSLVIAPSSLAYNWCAEAQRFCPELKVIVLRELADRGQGRSFARGEVVIASYGLIMRYAEHLAAIPWNIIVYDEAQQIKNALTKTARAAQALEARWILALSGTPIENRLSELWSLFRTISPGLFGEWERFRRSFVFPIERDRSAEAAQRLQRKIAPFVLRRMKRDYLAELPEKTEIDLWVDLDEDERQFYDALRGEAVAKLAPVESADAAEQAKQRMQVLAALTRLRQASCHRVLVDPSWEGSASKLELLQEKLGELSEAGHCSLVFSQFTRFLRLIEAALIADGRRVLYLDGETPPRQRQELVDRFQEGGYDTFLISLKAGGTGLNLTRASYVFHMDPWWNPAVEQQATDRAYRMGQKQAVTVYRLRARGTIEELIHAIHGEKRALVESVLAGREPDQAWSWDTMWQLLQGAPKSSGRIVPREAETLDAGE